MILRPWLVVTWPRHIATLGLYELWRRRNRLEIDGDSIVRRYGIIRHRNRVLPIARVQDVTVDRILFWAHVTISTAGGGPGVTASGPYSAWQARRFANTIRERLRTHPVTGV
jgi:membrane protein YdbS with pleckstrin-like domain